MLQTCSICQLTQEESLFPSAGVVRGKQYRRKQCRRCIYLTVKKPRKDKLTDWFENYKKQLTCLKCGNGDFRVFDFHHRDETSKTFNIGDMRNKGFGKERLLEEIAKCDCLCANCHRILTYESRKQVIS